MADATKIKLVPEPYCPKCPHSMLILCSNDFCVGRALAEALLRMGHDVHTQRITLTSEQFEAYVLTRALPTVDPKLIGEGD